MAGRRDGRRDGRFLAAVVTVVTTAVTTAAKKQRPSRRPVMTGRRQTPEQTVTDAVAAHYSNADGWI